MRRRTPVTTFTVPDGRRPDPWELARALTDLGIDRLADRTRRRTRAAGFALAASLGLVPLSLRFASERVPAEFVFWVGFGVTVVLVLAYGVVVHGIEEAYQRRRASRTWLLGHGLAACSIPDFPASAVFAADDPLAEAVRGWLERQGLSAAEEEVLIVLASDHFEGTLGELVRSARALAA